MTSYVRSLQKLQERTCPPEEVIENWWASVPAGERKPRYFLFELERATGVDFAKRRALDYLRAAGWRQWGVRWLPPPT